MTNSLRTSAGSHERFMVLEVFGRYAGFTAMLPTMAGAAHRCVIPEHKFDIERLTELLVSDRQKNPSHYSVVLVSEGAMFQGGEMVFEGETADAFGHKKLGGIGDLVSEKLKELSPKYNKGKSINTLTQKLGYLVRCGDPDAIDSIVPMAYGNLAFDLLLGKIHGTACGSQEWPLRQHAHRHGYFLEEKLSTSKSITMSTAFGPTTRALK